ncbi:hypothetical protein M408DRAFT_86429 [Serendipita vermifera MAFF 305830]|uniref:Uncharacterized protein n=1 Tax=Serendipita vermifera MAFF 305830 TaxID=933852 RepID=A0A0C3BQX6_SERVB|nr:hypothetical protein M408DRAFT_86429 [Serendipita vermifera MAFF 305830]
MMMFKTILFASVATLVGSTFGRAVPYQLPEARLAIRDISVVGVRSVPVQVPEIAVRGEHMKRAPVVPQVKRQEPIPAEVATKSDGGVIVPYSKRELEAYSKRQLPAEVASKSDGGAIVAYPKRQLPAEVASKSECVYLDLTVTERPLTRLFSSGGAIVAYPKRQEFPAEAATKSENGVISLY